MTYTSRLTGNTPTSRALEAATESFAAAAAARVPIGKLPPIPDADVVPRILRAMERLNVENERFRKSEAAE